MVTGFEMGFKVKILSIPFEAIVDNDEMTITQSEDVDVNASTKKYTLNEVFDKLKGDIDGIVQADGRNSGAEVQAPVLPTLDQTIKSNSQPGSFGDDVTVQLKKLYLHISGLGTDKPKFEFALWLQIDHDKVTPIIDFESAYLKLWSENVDDGIKQIMGITE